MTDHLSALMLDEIFAGVASAEVRTHSQTCSVCREVLVRFEHEVDGVRRSPEYRQVLARVTAGFPTPRPWRRFLVPAVAAGLAMSLAVVVWVKAPAADHARLKGSAHLVLLDSRGNPLEGPVAPGSRVSISVGTLGHPFALLMAVDEAGGVERLWPVQGVESGQLPVGADVRLDPPFEVTPGSIALWAFFSDSPLAEQDATAVLRTAVQRARTQGADLISSEPAIIERESARAHTQLMVR